MVSPQMAKKHSLPDLSLKGDALLVLDSGLQLAVHSVHLQQCSAVLADAIGLGQGSTQPGQQLKVPLPTTPNEEAELFIDVLYSRKAETMLRQKDMDQLRQLARICSRVAAEELLSMVDQACLLLVLCLRHVVRVCTLLLVMTSVAMLHCKTACRRWWTSAELTAAQHSSPSARLPAA